jgi:putative membrane protein
MFIIRWLIIAITIFLIGQYLPGIEVASIYTALIVAVIFGLLNSVIRPILAILTLPITLLTLGLSTLIISALLLWLTSTIVKGFSIASFSAALLAALVIWVVSFVSNAILKRA